MEFSSPSAFYPPNGSQALYQHMPSIPIFYISCSSMSSQCYLPLPLILFSVCSQGSMSFVPWVLGKGLASYTNKRFCQYVLYPIQCLDCFVSGARTFVLYLALGILYPIQHQNFCILSSARTFVSYPALGFQYCIGWQDICILFGARTCAIQCYVITYNPRSTLN